MCFAVGVKLNLGKICIFVHMYVCVYGYMCTYEVASRSDVFCSGMKLSLGKMLYMHT